jgi:hypothetical protein
MAQKESIQAQASQDAEKDTLAATKIKSLVERPKRRAATENVRSCFPSRPPGVRSQRVQESNV